MISGPTLRGVVLRGVSTSLLESHGDEGRAALFDGLSEESRRAMEGPILATTRVAASVFREVGDGWISLWGLDGPGGYRQAAAHVAEADLSTYMKLLLRVGSPAFVVTRFPQVWNHYFDAGELVVDKRKGRADVQLRGAAAYGAAGLEGAAGWMERALSLSLAKTAEVRRLGQGDDPAEYRVVWT